MPEAPFDRRAFLRTASFAALGVAAACTTGTGTNPRPTGTGTGTGNPSPTPPGPARALQWRRLASDPKPRSFHTFTANNDGTIAYMFGGKTKGKIYRDAWAYERSTGLWQPLPFMPEPRYGHTAAFIDGHFVIYGGRTVGDRDLSDAWAFDPVHGVWQKLSPGGSTPTPRFAAAGTTIANSLTMTHGIANGRELNDTWALSKRWTNVTPRRGSIPPKRALARAAYVSGLTRMVLFGGQAGPALLGDTWLYDPSTLTWAKANVPGPSPRTMPIAAATRRTLYLFGGDVHGRQLRDVWSFDGAAWRLLHPAGSPPLARAGAEGAVIAGPSMVFFGGSNGTTDLNDCWELTLPG